MLKKLLLAVSVVCMFVVIPSVAAAASLDGETVTGITGGPLHCGDNGDGTSQTPFQDRGRFTRYSGPATGPVAGTFSGGAVFATWNTATGSVTEFDTNVDISSADGTTDVGADISLGSGQGIATCANGSWTLNVTGATYVVEGTGDTGVVSVSATGPTFTAVFGPQLPTSTAQCKNDGWKTFPGFKNQGDCVSYVATKGKNKPAGS